MAKFLAALLALFLFVAYASANAGWLSSKQGKTFETRGTAVIRANFNFLFSTDIGTTKIERKDIPIPAFINIESSAQWSELTHDRETGWTKCRVPLKGDSSIVGNTERELIFDCRPTSYYK